MSGSETGLIASREAYGAGLQRSPVSSQPMIQNMRLAFNADGTTVYQQIAPSSPSYNQSAATDGSTGGTTAAQGSGTDFNVDGESMKVKRGRPRKYGPEGSMALVLAHPPIAVPVSQSSDALPSSHPPHVSATPSPTGAASHPSFKKARGRPPGSTKKQRLEAHGGKGHGFTPHIISVKAGEDVSAKIMSFSQHGPRAVCVLSANGSISNVTLRQPASSGGTVTYEGRFEILSLCGSFLLTEDFGQRVRSGGLSVSLAGPDGRVLGGGVAGLLTAAAPVQVVVGSFITGGRGEGWEAAHPAEPKFPVTSPVGATGRPCSPPSGATSGESSSGGSPANQTA